MWGCGCPEHSGFYPAIERMLGAVQPQQFAGMRPPTQAELDRHEAHFGKECVDEVRAYYGYPVKGKPTLKSRMDQVIELRKQGYTIQELMDELSLSESRIRRLLKGAEVA